MFEKVYRNIFVSNRLKTNFDHLNVNQFCRNRIFDQKQTFFSPRNKNLCQQQTFYQKIDKINRSKIDKFKIDKKIDKIGNLVNNRNFGQKSKIKG